MGIIEEIKDKERKDFLENLNKIRSEYILDKRNDNNSKKSFGADIYKKFVDIFGKETMLNLDSSNVLEFEHKLDEYGSDIITLSGSLKGLIKDPSSQSNNMYFEHLNNTKKGIEFLDSFYEIYVPSKIKKEDEISILNNTELHMSNAEKIYGMGIYDKLVRIYGEELILNSENLSMIRNGSLVTDKFGDETNYNLLKFIGADLKKLEEMEGITDESEYIPADNLDGVKILDYIISIKRPEEEKNKFKKLFENSEIISKENIDILMMKLDKNLENGIDVFDDLDGEYIVGEYVPHSKKIIIRRGWDVPQILTHEMLHAVSSEIDFLYGDVKRVGLMGIDIDSGQCVGTAINEGVTEFLTQKLLGGKTDYDVYEDLVALASDLANLYGKENIFDAYLNSPNKLATLMEKDGQDYRDLLQMTDSYYQEVYCSGLLPKEACGQEKVKLEAKKITEFIEQIREKKRKENPGLVLPECEWEKTYNKMAGIEEQKFLDGEKQQNSFRFSLKQENFESDFEQSNIPNIQQENIKNEKKNNLDIENER